MQPEGLLAIALINILIGAFSNRNTQGFYNFLAASWVAFTAYDYNIVDGLEVARSAFFIYGFFSTVVLWAPLWVGRIAKATA